LVPQLLRLLLAAALATAAFAARAEFVFATPEEGAAILGARDDYVRATGALERQAKLRTAEPVDEARFVGFMAETALPWTDEERTRVEAALTPLDRFLAGLKWQPSRKILLVKTNDRLEEGLPHTRANAIVLPEVSLRDAAAGALAYFLSHEVFHVLSRDDPALREELYGAIGFRACAKMEIPRPLAETRITNPDAPASRHTIKVRWQGKDVEALPFVHFPSAGIDPRKGFKDQLRVSWLLVERALDGCRMRAPAEGVPPQELQGLLEQIGRNTRYIMHPEEILADNFAVLYLSKLRSDMPKPPSPELLLRLEKILARSGT
jgi:hypothetical protein